MNGFKVPNDGIFTRVAIGTLDEGIHSYFYSAYQWAPFWYPMLKRAINIGSPTVNRLCSFAIVYGCMGKELKAQTLLAKSRALYAETLRQAQSLIEHSDKAALAELIPTVLMMAMYDVSFLSYLK